MAKSKANSPKTSGKSQHLDLSKVSTHDLLNGNSLTSDSLKGGLPKNDPIPEKPRQEKPRQEKPHQEKPLEGDALIKETCRRLRAAKSLWDAHRNAACRNEREKALALYNQLTKAQKEKVPQPLRIWLRYRSEKYFGAHQTAPGQNKRSGKKRANKSSTKPSSKIFKKGQ